VKVKSAKNFFISILTGKFFILDIIIAKINMHIFNVTYLKSKVDEIKEVSDTHNALNLETMRKEIKISCLPRCSRQNEITKMTFEGRKVRVSWKMVGGGK